MEVDLVMLCPMGQLVCMIKVPAIGGLRLGFRSSAWLFEFWIVFIKSIFRRSSLIVPCFPLGILRTQPKYSKLTIGILE